MKISRVEVDLVKIPARTPPFLWRAGLPGSEPELVGGVLRVVSDDGLEGVAHCRRGVILEDVVNRRIRDELIGEDPMRREWLWHRMWELRPHRRVPRLRPRPGRHRPARPSRQGTGVPVYELLGACRSEIPAYASTATFSSIEEYLDVADQCLELGYRAIKLHAWGDARRDAELAQALRAHVGDGVDLMYDGSAGFDLPDAVYLGRALAEAAYRWYEEPIREFSVTSYQAGSPSVSRSRCSSRRPPTART